MVRFDLSTVVVVFFFHTIQFGSFRLPSQFSFCAYFQYINRTLILNWIPLNVIFSQSPIAAAAVVVSSEKSTGSFNWEEMVLFGIPSGYKIVHCTVAQTA